jgi:calcineurin-like phosphoesterase family protein
MMNVWFTSNNLFNSGDYDHDTLAISRWNAMVEPDDTVIVLGNFIRGKLDTALQICSQLNGNIHIVMDKKEKQFQKLLYELLSACSNIMRVERNYLSYDDFEASTKYKKTHRFLVFGEKRDNGFKLETERASTCADWEINGGPVNGWTVLRNARTYNQLRSL